MGDNQKLSLQAFLQLLSSKNLSISRAMTVASKIFKDYNTPARLGELTDPKLLSLGISDKEDRRLVLSALNAAGYRTIAVTNAKQQQRRRIAKNRTVTRPGGINDDDHQDVINNISGEPSTPKKRTPALLPLPSSSPPGLVPLPPSSSSPPSSASASASTSSSPQKKRKHSDITSPTSQEPSSQQQQQRRFENECLPINSNKNPAAVARDEEGEQEQKGVTLLDGTSNLDFHEVLDEDALKHKFTVVNRAPVMMAWASVVAECLGFSRDEALSIASVYTEMNAVSKGVSLGIFDKKRENDLKAAHAEVEAQPYVDLLGRRIPLFRIASGSWRAFTTEDDNGCSMPGGGAAPPRAAYGYITRSLRQTAPAVLGAMRLLAESYDDPVELNRVGFSLYADFRPDVSGWGKRGELRCETLLGLRKKGPKDEPNELNGVDGQVKTTGDSGQGDMDTRRNEEPSPEEPEDAFRGTRAGRESDVEPNTVLDTSFDELDGYEFTTEELSVLP